MARQLWETHDVGHGRTLELHWLEGEQSRVTPARVEIVDDEAGRIGIDLTWPDLDRLFAVLVPELGPDQDTHGEADDEDEEDE